MQMVDIFLACLIISGKVDEKATQLHAIASLKVLLDATKPQDGINGTAAGVNGADGVNGAGGAGGAGGANDSGRASQGTEVSAETSTAAAATRCR